MAVLIPMVGKVFGRLTVVSKEKLIGKKWYWNCQCSCGTLKTVEGYNLRSGKSSSCGCLQIELTIKRSTRHGLSKTKTYAAWINMRNRCTNPNNIQYSNYGARGITVCKRWDNFENFLVDMSEAPSKYTIERIKNNLGYNPDNCRWVTNKVNCNNKRNNRRLTYNNKTQTTTEWAEELEIAESTLRKRIKMGWSIKRALTELAS